MDKRPSISIKSSDFAFTNNELIFVKKYLHPKYPNSMSNVIDDARQLMKQIQTAAKSNEKLIYYASRTHPEDTERYVVMEMLYDYLPDGHVANIGIEPIEDKTKDPRDAKTIARHTRSVLEQLTNLSLSPKDVRLVGCGFIPHRHVLNQVAAYLDANKQELIVQEDFSLVLDPNNSPHLYIAMRHKLSLSHYIRVRFDFFEQTDVQREPKQPEEEGVEES
jgi:hypothetical protein